MGLLWYGTVLAWDCFGLGLFWFGTVLVGLFRWDCFGLGLFHTVAIPKPFHRLTFLDTFVVTLSQM